jgi:SAM-dependent methyltransferase
MTAAPRPAGDPDAQRDRQPVEPDRFVAERPKDLRRATPWHRYGHHIRTLPARLEALSQDLRVPPGGRVLDYGCAEMPYRHFFGPDVEFIGADLPGNPAATLTLNDDATIPLPDASVDAVMSTQVLEHVADPALYLSECFRVLRPNGRLLLSTHGIFIYHPDPIDYWRWTCAGLQHVVEEAGLEVVRFEGIIGLAATGIQLVQDAMYHSLPRLVRPFFAFCMQSLAVLADRIEGPASRNMNAQVYGLVAEKPAS